MNNLEFIQAVLERELVYVCAYPAIYDKLQETIELLKKEIKGE